MLLNNPTAFRQAIVLAGVLMLAAMVRVPHIYGDPPAGDISRSGDFLADEGTHGHNALHWALTGEWYMPDTYNPAVNTPIFTLFEYLLMRFFGVSLATVRYGAVFCGMIALLLLYVLLRRHEATAASVAMLLGAANFPLIVYNRLALMENLLLCFLLACALLLIGYCRQPSRRWLLLVFWMAFALGYLTKVSIIFFAVVFFGMIWQLQAAARKQTLHLTAACLVVLAGASWFFWIAPHLDDWQHYQQLNIAARFTLSPAAVAQSYGRYFAHLRFFEFMPVMYAIALMMALRGARDLVLKRDLDAIPRLLCLWFWVGLLFLGALKYSPPRYSLLLLPAILGLNGLFFAELFKPLPETRTWPRHSFSIVAGLILLQVLFGFYRIVVYRQTLPSCFLPAAGFLALYVISRSMNHEEWARRKTAWTLLGLIVAVQGAQILRFHVTMEYSLYETMQQVAKIFQQENRQNEIVLAGDSAMLLAFELRVPTVDIMYRQDKLPQLIQRMRPNYLFLEDPAELARLQKQMPEYWRHLTVLGRFRLMNNYTHGQDAVLYRVEDAHRALRQE